MNTQIKNNSIPLSKIKFIFLIFILMIINVSVEVKSQNPQWRVFNYQNSNLPNEYFHTIEIDSNNIKWISGERGLIRFDGVNVTYFDSTNSVLKNRLENIKIGKNNSIWMTPLRQGLAKYENGIITLYDTSNSGLPWNPTRGLSIESDSIVWVGTGKGEVVRFDGINWDVFDSTDFGFRNSGVNNINILNNVKWICTLAGLIRYDGNEWKRFNLGNSGIPDYWIWSSSFESDNILWVSTLFGGFARFDYLNKNTVVYNNKNSGLPLNEVTRIFYYKPDSTVFLAVTGFGLHILKNNKVIPFSNFIPAHYATTDFKIDKYNNLWISTSRGIFQYNPNGIVNIASNNRLVSGYNLKQNYPNPFNPETNIEFDIPKTSEVSVTVYDALGREISKLLNKELNPGIYKINWNAESLPSGVYFYKLSTNNFSQTKRMILMK